MGFFDPDRFFSRITAIDVQQDLLRPGLRNVLLDIDNTIRSRATGDIPQDVGLWLAKARDAGVRFCLLSNNWHNDVRSFAEELEMPIVAKACKPLPHGYLRAMKKLGAACSESVIIGDQLLTDTVGAHIVGIKAYLVLPLAEQDIRRTLFLRNIERMILGEAEPERMPAGAQGASGAPELTLSLKADLPEAHR